MDGDGAARTGLPLQRAGCTPEARLSAWNARAEAATHAGAAAAQRPPKAPQKALQSACCTRRAPRKPTITFSVKEG